MDRNGQNLEEKLIDWHLDRLEESERAWLDEELRRDAALRKTSDRLGRILQPLDHWSVPAAPHNLADKVLAYVAEQRDEPVSTVPFPTEPKPYRRAPFFALRDVIAAAACIALLVTVVVPGISSIRDRSRRANCSNNLASVFRGVSAYQTAFSGALPFSGLAANASWLPGDGDSAFASNSRHAFLLVKLNYGPETKDFVCPGCDKSFPMDPKTASGGDDFAQAANLSYATMNLAGKSPNLRPCNTMPYLSDANPLFVKTRFDASVDPNTANSRSHRGKGQTVLTVDGSATWITTPVYGKKQDNLWLAGELRVYKGTETPSCADDAHLVPGFPITDPAVQRRVPRFRQVH